MAKLPTLAAIVKHQRLYDTATLLWHYRRVQYPDLIKAIAVVLAERGVPVPSR